MDLCWWHFFSLYAIKLKLTILLEKLAKHLHNRERSYEFCGKELPSVVERKDHLTNATQTVFHKASVVKYPYVHHKPSLVFKVTGK